MSVYFDVDGRPVGRLDDELSGFGRGRLATCAFDLPPETLPGTDIAASLVVRFPMLHRRVFALGAILDSSSS